MFDAQPVTDAFGDLRGVVRAWGGATEALISEAVPAGDAKTHRTSARKLGTTNTMLALGYLFGNERRGNATIMQSAIVNALVEGTGPEAEAERRRLRQDIRRRFDALEYFGLVDRVHLTPTAVQLSLTEAGRSFRRQFDAACAVTTGDAFAALRGVVRAWGSATEALIAGAIPAGDAKTHRTSARKLGTTDTMLALGYLFGNERRGNATIMQSAIVNALVEGTGPEAEAERRRLRQDIRRRFDALEYFGLVDRVHLTPTAVQLSLTEAGRAFRQQFDAAYAVTTNTFPSGR